MEVRLIHESGVKVFTPKTFRDHRGIFIEGHRLNEIEPHIKPCRGFVQSCVSASLPFVVRGLHYQLRRKSPSPGLSSGPGQGKLIRCVAGRIFQVSVDMRANSPTYGKWVNQILDDITMEAVWVPPGFANGFMAFERGAVVQYEMTEYHDAEQERQLLWNDPTVGVIWPGGAPVLSAKDKMASRFDAAEAWV